MLDSKAKLEVVEEAQRELAQLLEKRKEYDEINRRIGVLQNFISNAKFLWKLNGASGEKPAPTNLTVQLEDTLKMPEHAEAVARPTVATVAKEILQSAGKPMHVIKILEELRKRGLQLQSKYPATTVVVALKRRSGEFVKVRPNTFALREWYDDKEKKMITQN